MGPGRPARGGAQDGDLGGTAEAVPFHGDPYVWSLRHSARVFPETHRDGSEDEATDVRQVCDSAGLDVGDGSAPGAGMRHLTGSWLPFVFLHPPR